MKSAFWIVRLDHKDPRSPELMDQLLREAMKGCKVYIIRLSGDEASWVAGKSCELETVGKAVGG